MKATIKYSLFIVLILLLTTCKKMHVVTEGQKILFQYDYINYSRGFEHSGFIIDNEGNILYYNKPEKWNFPGKEKILTQAEIEENLLSCTLSGRIIPKGDLKKFTNYINNIAASKVTAPRIRPKAAKSGTISYYCFLYSESNSEYKVVTIKTDGEMESDNLNFYSRKVVEWMKGIQKSLNK